MISVNSSYRSDITLAAFPDVLVDFYRMYSSHSGSPESKVLLNRPDLDYWLLVVEEQVSLKEMADLFNCNAFVDMNRLFAMYTIISAANRRVLKRKMRGFNYFRSRWDDSLSILKWVSAKYVCSEPGKILFMQSPILLFDRSFSVFLSRDWFSAFTSLLSTGALEIMAYHTHFCLGAFKLSFSDLEIKQLSN